jgi:ATP-binding cassette subfamily F protein 3
MAVLIASDLRKELGGEPLFDGVSFTVGRRDRLSLAGPNGAGKTTLLRALAGETPWQGGRLAFAKGTRIALHDQRPPLEFDVTLREYTASGARDVLQVEAELERLERAMAEGAHDELTLRRYTAAQSRLEHAGGWAWRDRVAAAVRGLGFADADLDRPLGSFSGGELTRASLARALAASPDLLLLDEPTNHLDVRNLEWLEQELRTIDAAVILVAHDRWFLEAVTTSVLELSPGGAHYFAGPWHEWRREQAARAAAAGRTAARVSDDIARLDRFVARFRYKRSKAKQAQAKLTQIGRLERERAVARVELESLTKTSRVLDFDFPRAPRTGRVVVEAQGVTLSAGDKRLLENATLVIERGEKVGLVGPNGSGKTTLLEAILGGRPLDAGETRLGHGVVPGYFSQHTQALPSSGSVLDATASATGLPRPQAQALLGRFLLSGRETHERAVSALSGGERRRLALAILVASGANFLVLDEPTNHLDLASSEALEAALVAFPGAVLLVSHDRALLDAVPDRIVALEDRALHSYAGGWATAASAPAEPAAPVRSGRATPRKPPSRPEAAKPTELDLVEARIGEVEEHIAELETRLAEDWTDLDVLTAHRAARDELTRLLARWEALFEAAQSDTTPPRSRES